MDDAVRKERSRTEASNASPLIQSSHVSIHVVDPDKEDDHKKRALSQSKLRGCSPVRVRRILLVIPLAWERILLVNPRFCLRFVVHGIKANNALQENVQLWVGARILRHLEQGSKDVYKVRAKSIWREKDMLGTEKHVLVTISSKLSTEPLAL